MDHIRSYFRTCRQSGHLGDLFERTVDLGSEISGLCCWIWSDHGQDTWNIFIFHRRKWRWECLPLSGFTKLKVRLIKGWLSGSSPQCHTCRCLITVCQVSAGLNSTLREHFPNVKSSRCHDSAPVYVFLEIKKKSMRSVAEALRNWFVATLLFQASQY